jgi:DNA-binding NarL/FixJ family response regulator
VAPPEGSTNVRLRLVVADDHPAIVDAVCRFLEEVEEIDVVGRAGDGARALQEIHESEPDVALLDIRMPYANGIEIAKRLADGGSKTAVILYTGYPERALLMEALDAGARGFLVKEAPLDDVVRAIKVVAAGGIYIDPALAAVVAGPQVVDRLPALTQREREVLRLLADGMRNEQVGAQLAISPLTVRTHVKNVMDKLEADTRTQAVASALRQSLIS